MTALTKTLPQRCSGPFQASPLYSSFQWLLCREVPSTVFSHSSSLVNLLVRPKNAIRAVSGLQQSHVRSVGRRKSAFTRKHDILGKKWSHDMYHSGWLIYTSCSKIPISIGPQIYYFSRHDTSHTLPSFPCPSRSYAGVASNWFQKV